MTIDKAVEFYGNPDFEKYGAEKAAYVYFHSRGNRKDFGFIIIFDNATEKILKLEISGDNSMVTFDDFFEGKINYELGIAE